MMDPNGPLDRAAEATARLLASRDARSHGFLCPVWVKRRRKGERREDVPHITECNCWVLRNARRDTRLVIQAYLKAIAAEVVEYVAEDENV